MLLRIGALMVLVFFIYTNTIAQNDENRAEVKALMWGDDDKYKAAFDIPDKWKNESAVVIYQELMQEFKAKSCARNIIYDSFRKRIKLLDKAAVENFSEFSLVENPRPYSYGGGVVMGLKVIKPDRTERFIDLTEAVEIDGAGGGTAKKVAVPDLAPGDILDYYYYYFQPISAGVYSYEPHVSTLSGTYPIMNQKVKFILDENFYLNFVSYNGAPDIKYISPNDKKNWIYELVDTDRDRKKNQRWYYGTREEPSIKFQVYYVCKDDYAQTGYAYYGQEGVVKNDVDLNEVMDKGEKTFKFPPYSKNEKKAMDEKFPKTSDKLELLKDMYNQFRFDDVTHHLEQRILYEEGYLTYARHAFKSYEERLIAMGRFCQSYDFDFDVLFIMPRAISKMDQLCYRDELYMLIKVNLDEPIYLTPWYLFSEFNKIPSYLEGAEAIEAKVNELGTLSSGKYVTVPVSDHESNNISKEINIDFSDLSASELNIVQRTISRGYPKSDFQSELLIPENYIDHAQKYFNVEANLEMSRMKKKDQEKLIAKYSEYKADKRKEQKSTFEKYLKQNIDFSVEEYKDFEIMTIGRLGERTFEYKESFSITNELVKKAGKNYLLSVGSLIGGQVAIKEEEKDRKNNIWMPYARSYSYNINIELPENSKVEGLEKLNLDVANSTGGFKSKATLEGNKLNVNCEKWYTHNYEAVENWPQMMDFLDKTFQFTQEKLLIKME